jgi:hypothetical protein
MAARRSAEIGRSGRRFALNKLKNKARRANVVISLRFSRNARGIGRSDMLLDTFFEIPIARLAAAFTRLGEPHAESGEPMSQKFSQCPTFQNDFFSP